VRPLVQSAEKTLQNDLACYMKHRNAAGVRTAQTQVALYQTHNFIVPVHSGRG